jgi:hypothetical protein
MSLTILPHNHYVAFECYGVRIALLANDTRVVQRLHSFAPAQSRPIELDEAEHQVSVTTKDGLRFATQYEVRGERAGEIEGDLWIGGDADLALALAHLEKHVGECIGLNAPDHLFLRGGSVLHRGRALVVAGEGLAGTTTLLEALVRAGATPYSDSFAVFDSEGRAVPFTKRPAGTRIDDNGNGNGNGNGTSADHAEPIPVDAIVETSYTPGAAWQPERVSGGTRMLALLVYAVPSEERPKDAMSAVARILEQDPVVIRGHRGEADEVARALLADAELQGSGAA